MLVLLGEQYTEGSYVGIIRWTVYRGFLCWYYYVNSIHRVLMLVLLGEQYTEGCYVGIIMWTVYRGFLCCYY